MERNCKTVAELIEELNQMPEDLPVFYCDSHAEYNQVKNIERITVFGNTSGGEEAQVDIVYIT